MPLVKYGLESDKGCVEVVIFLWKRVVCYVVTMLELHVLRTDKQPPQRKRKGISLTGMSLVLRSNSRDEH